MPRPGSVASHFRRGFAALATAALLATATLADAQATPEQKCHFGRMKAAGKYADCVQTARAKFQLTPQLLYADSVAHDTKAGKCVKKYAAAWTILQAKASGSGTLCDNPRLVDNADGTVTDRLTALQWEKKTTDATVHDLNNSYTWSAGPYPAGAAADGTLFTIFLATLNGGGCFAGECDWRLPTRDELRTITTPAYPACTNGGPCIDPIFGPTLANLYWTATPATKYANYSWALDFFRGATEIDANGNDLFVRAVRGGGL